MSLLMDALRKAEEAKIQAESEARARLLQTDSADSEPTEVDQQKSASSSAAEISLELETYPESDSNNQVTDAVAQGNEVIGNDDIISDLESTADSAPEEIHNKAQTLDLETIPFDDEIPTLVPESLQANEDVELDLFADSDEISKEAPETELQQGSAAPMAALASDSSALEQGVDKQPENQDPSPAAEQSPRTLERQGFQESPESGEIALELDSLVEDFNPAIEPAVIAPEQEKGAKQAGLSGFENADYTEQTQTAKTRPVSNAKSHFSAQSIFAAKANARKAKRNRLQLAAVVVAALAVGAVYGFNWWTTNNSTARASLPEDYLGGEALSSAVAPVLAADSVDGQITTDSTLQLQPETGVDAAATSMTVNAIESDESTALEAGQLSARVTPVITELPVENLLAVAPAEQSNQPSLLISEQSTPVAPQVATAEVIPPRNLINFNRSNGQSTLIDSSLERAYQAYQTGDLDSAQRYYQAALATAPLNRNALLGLAAIANGKNESIVALDLYSRLLSRDPSDPIARAGILDLQPAGNIQRQEQELKNLITAHPAIAPLRYALGNLYAVQQRWSEAQQAYFNALRIAKSSSLEPGMVNPDYAYNLAVSLEHLNQQASARNYYQEALEYSAYHPASFDVERIRSRLANFGGGQAR